MEIERWQQIEQLYNSVFDEPPDRRAALLDEACSGDPDLRREVESLLSATDEAHAFLSKADLKAHIRTLTSEPTAPVLGTSIGHYQVLSFLGAGAMGEVYLARDTKLERRVALKLLPHRYTQDPKGVTRFVREAKAASSLNDPNIITIHEIGQTGDTWFMAAEFIEGVTLRDRLASGKLTIQELLDIAIQCAAALDTAHRHGIVHRDIKPENIMIRPDGLVKVLDFGLARVFEGRHAGGAGESQVGVIMGTPRYMSPEQGRGEALDERTDIFSLGSVIYEMTAGRPAFPGETTADVFAALLAPVAPLPEQTPAALERTILKALEKDRESRFKSMTELAAGLKECRELLRAGIALPSAQGRRSRVRRRFLLVGAVLSLLIGALVAVTRFPVFPGLSNRNGSPESSLTVPLTSFGGYKRFPAFSPDGRRIAFSWDGDSEGKGDKPRLHLYVKPVGEGEPKQLTFSPAGDDLAASWSPDGRSIAFCRNLPDASGYGIYIVPADGGPEQKVAEAGLGVSWSGDGRTLALAHKPNSDRLAAQQSGGIFLFSLETGQSRDLTAGHLDNLPQFSPNGKWVGFTRVVSDWSREIVVTPAGGGSARQLTFDGQPTSGVAWTADSRDVVFSSTRKGGGWRVWRAPIDGGEPRPLPAVNLRGLSQLTIARQGGRLAYSDFLLDTNIYLRAGPGFQGAAVPGPFGEPAGLALSSRLDHSPAISPDGERIAFVSARTGYEEIWISRRDGGQPVPLSSLRAASTGTPRWSPDGRWIAFDSSLSGTSAIYVIDSQGGNPRQLAAQAFVPAWSPEGKWIYFASGRSGRTEIWKTRLTGGAVEQVTETGANEALPAANGTIYFTKQVPGAEFAIWYVPAGGGPESPVPELQKFDRITRSWGVVREGIYFLSKNEPSRQVVRFLSFRTHQVTPLFAVPKETVWDVPAVALSQDGRYALVVQMDHRINDLVMIDNFR